MGADVLKPVTFPSLPRETLVLAPGVRFWPVAWRLGGAAFGRSGGPSSNLAKAFPKLSPLPRELAVVGSLLRRSDTGGGRLGGSPWSIGRPIFESSSSLGRLGWFTNNSRGVKWIPAPACVSDSGLISPSVGSRPFVTRLVGSLSPLGSLRDCTIRGTFCASSPFKRPFLDPGSAFPRFSRLFRDDEVVWDASLPSCGRFGNGPALPRMLMPSDSVPGASSVIESDRARDGVGAFAFLSRWIVFSLCESLESPEGRLLSSDMGFVCRG